MEYENKNLSYERDQIPGTDILFDLDGSITAEKMPEKSRSYASRATKQIRTFLAFSLGPLYIGKKRKSKDSNPRTDPVRGDWSGLQDLI